MARCGTRRWRIGPGCTEVLFRAEQSNGREAGTLDLMDTNERRENHETTESPAGSERGWSRFTAFPIMLAAIFGLLWKDRRAVPDVPQPRVLRDVHLR